VDLTSASSAINIPLGKLLELSRPKIVKIWENASERIE
jgi:hypothetical protein